MSEISNKYVSITLYAKNEPIHEVLSTALRVAAALGSKVELNFSDRYLVPIWPDSNLSDLKRIEELSNQVFNLTNSIAEKNSLENK